MRYILKAEQTEFALESDVGMWGIGEESRMTPRFVA